MEVNEQDFDAVQEAVETLKENGFEVEAIERVSGFEEREYDRETDEERILGRKTNFDLSLEKKHY